MVVMRKSPESTPRMAALSRGCLLLGERVLPWTRPRAGSFTISGHCFFLAILLTSVRFLERILRALPLLGLWTRTFVHLFVPLRQGEGAYISSPSANLSPALVKHKSLFFSYISRVGLQFTLLWELHRKFRSASNAGGKGGGGVRRIRLQEGPREEPELSKSH